MVDTHAPHAPTGWRRPPLALLCSLLLAAWWAASVAAAQTPPQDLLNTYQAAQAALSGSAAAFQRDRVEALDSLRRAGALLPDITADLAPSLQRGLEATLARAETALVNESETDFAVQRAVLGGGLQRALFEHALKRAEAGEVTRAQELLGVLGEALALRPPTFEQEEAQTLQLAFERRLAEGSLERLEALPTGDQGRDYRLLAEHYGTLLSVQGSPRLPAETTAALLQAITQVVSEEPPEEALTALRIHLSTFRAAAVGAAEARAVEAPTASTGSPEQPPVPASSAAAARDSTPPNTLPTAQPTPGQGLTGEGLAGEQGPIATERVLTATPLALGDAALDDAVLDDIAAATPDNPVSNAVSSPDVSNMITGDTNGTLDALLSTLLGALALVASARALQGAVGHRRASEAAAALLLLPAVLEGLTALPELSGARLLAPLAGLAPLEAPLRPFWVLSVALAVLCLALGWRRSARRAPTPPQDTSAETQARTPRAVAVAPRAGGSTPKINIPQGLRGSQGSPRPALSLASTGIDWDEDF